MLKAFTAATLIMASCTLAFAIPSQVTAGPEARIEKAADVAAPRQDPDARKWIGQTIDRFLSDDGTTVGPTPKH